MLRDAMENKIVSKDNHRIHLDESSEIIFIYSVKAYQTCVQILA